MGSFSFLSFASQQRSHHLFLFYGYFSKAFSLQPSSSTSFSPTHTIIMHSTRISAGVVAALTSTAIAQGIKTVTRTHSTVVTTAIGTVGTAVGTGNAPNPTAARQLTIFNLYGLAPDVTPVISIVSARPTATCFEVACPRSVLDEDSEKCGVLQAPMTVTEGASAVQFTYSSAATGQANATIASTSPRPTNSTSGSSGSHFSASCSIEGTTKAVCAAYTIPAATPKEQAHTHTYSGTEMWQPRVAQITAGSYKLLNNTNGAVGSGSVSGTAGSTTGRLPPKPTTTSQQETSSAPSSSSTSSPDAAAGVGVPAVGSVAGLLLAIAALL